MVRKKIIVPGIMIVFFFFLIGLKIEIDPVKSNLTLSNIEALASYEFGENIFCLGTGSLDCPKSLYKVDFIRTYNECKIK